MLPISHAPCGDNSPPLLIPGEALIESARALGQALTQRGMFCATAESCTGGLAGAALTAVPGASAWFAGGIIAYANSVKIRALGVEDATLAEYGAVSEAVVRQMALGACRALGVEAALSLSGVAGPDGGTPEKPVGLVWVGFAVGGITDALELRLSGGREEVRAAAVGAAVRGLWERLG